MPVVAGELERARAHDVQHLFDAVGAGLHGLKAKRTDVHPRAAGAKDAVDGGGGRAHVGARHVDEPRRHHHVQRCGRERRMEGVRVDQRQAVSLSGRTGQDAIDDHDLVRDRVDGELRERDRLAGEQLRGDQEWKRVHVEGERPVGRAGVVDVDRESTGSRAVDGDTGGTRRQQRRDELQRLRALAATQNQSRNRFS